MIELESDLRDLCKKYGIENAAFCGEASGKFIGIITPSHAPILNCFATVLNVGRLWQAMREETMAMLNLFEKGGEQMTGNDCHYYLQCSSPGGVPCDAFYQEFQREHNSYYTDALIDMLNLQDKAASEMTVLADSFRRRQRLIRAHIAAHSNQIDFGRVLSGR